MPEIRAVRSGTQLMARCPDCPSMLAVAHEGDRIEHVGPVSAWWPYGEHRMIPAQEDD